MRSAILTLALFFLSTQEEGEPTQPHTSDPAQCKLYCHPKGSDLRPKGVPPDAVGYECKGDHCAKAVEEGGDIPCDEQGSTPDTKCTTWCAKPCCSCTQICM